MKVIYSIFFLSILLTYSLSCKTPPVQQKEESEKTEITKVLPQYTSEAENRFKKLESIPESSKIFIKMIDDNRVLLNSVETSDSILKIKIKEFILEKNPDYAISVHSHNKTKYSTYLRIQKIIKEAYGDIKNDYSINKFNTTYELSDSIKKHQIDSLFPVNIFDFEPSN